MGDRHREREDHDRHHAVVRRRQQDRLDRPQGPQLALAHQGAEAHEDDARHDTGGEGDRRPEPPRRAGETALEDPHEERREPEGEGRQPERSLEEQVGGEAGGETERCAELRTEADRQRDRRDEAEVGDDAEDAQVRHQRRLEDDEEHQEEREAHEADHGIGHSRTRTNAVLPASAYSFTAMRAWRSPGRLRTDTTRPTGMSGGKGPPSVPAVTRMSPALMSPGPSRLASSCNAESGRPLMMPRWFVRTSRTFTPESRSVSNSTVERRPDARAMRPSRPRPDTTGWSTTMPSSVPLSSATVASKLPGEPRMICASTPLRSPTKVRCASLRRSRLSRNDACACATFPRADWSSRRRRRFSALMSPARVTPSHQSSIGCVRLSTPSCTGAKTSRTALRTRPPTPLSPPRVSRVMRVIEVRTSRIRIVRRRFGHAEATVPAQLPRPLAGLLGDQVLEGGFLEVLPRAEHDRVERVLGDRDRHPCLGLEPAVETVEQRTAPRDHDALLHDVSGELGRRLVQCHLHRVDDRRHRLLDRLADLLGRHDDRLRQPGDEVAPAHLGVELLLELERAREGLLDLLRGALTQRE